MVNFMVFVIFETVICNVVLILGPGVFQTFQWGENEMLFCATHNDEYIKFWVCTMDPEKKNLKADITFTDKTSKKV